MIVSHEKARQLHRELEHRGPGTVAELATRTAWPEAVVKGALRLLGDAGEVDYEVRTGPDKAPVKVWTSAPSEC